MFETPERVSHYQNNKCGLNGMCKQSTHKIFFLLLITFTIARDPSMSHRVKNFYEICNCDILIANSLSQISIEYEIVWVSLT